MRWIKKGRIGKPGLECYFGTGRLMCPTPIQLSKDIIRIFLGFCDDQGVSRVGFFDVKTSNPKEVVSISDHPVLDLGTDGAFDDNGVVPVSVNKCGDKLFLYYIGFQLGVKVDYYMFCGLAISEDNGLTFYRYERTPILDRNDEELFARAGCNVFRYGTRWTMQYVGSKGSGWIIKDGKKLPLYTMKQLYSKDGIDWGNKPGVQILDFINCDEHGFGRPSVFYSNKNSHMVYSIRTLSNGYKLGYANSVDGIHWVRHDEHLFFEGENQEWDSINMCYPAIISVKNKILMFYNGNYMGKSGFGFAELVEL